MINQIETGSSGDGNEVDISDMYYGFNNYSIIIFPYYAPDGTVSFGVSQGNAVTEQTLIPEMPYYIYVAVFKNTDQKVKVWVDIEYDGDSDFHSCLIDISKSKVYIVKENELT